MYIILCIDIYRKCLCYFPYNKTCNYLIKKLKCDAIFKFLTRCRHRSQSSHTNVKSKTNCRKRNFEQWKTYHQ